MRNWTACTLPLSLLFAVPAGAAPRLAPEAQLARELEGRVAGDPVQCISLRNVRSSRIVNRTAILYEVGSTIYVNRPDAGAEQLSDWDVLVTDTHTSQLCDFDVVRLYDSDARFQRGFVFLGDFVPYRKVRNASR